MGPKVTVVSSREPDEHVIRFDGIVKRNGWGAPFTILTDQELIALADNLNYRVKHFIAPRLEKEKNEPYRVSSQ